MELGHTYRDGRGATGLVPADEVLGYVSPLVVHKPVDLRQVKARVLSAVRWKPT